LLRKGSDSGTVLKAQPGVAPDPTRYLRIRAAMTSKEIFPLC
jgi:hypothetical protein